MIFAIKPLATHWNFVTEKNSSNPARYMSRYHFSCMNLGKVRKTFGGQVWVKYEPLVNWVSSDMHVGQEAMSCNVCIVAIPEICAQTQGSDYLHCITYSLMSVNMWTEVLLYISADTKLLCWLLVSVDIRSTDALKTRDQLLLTTYLVRKFGGWQSLKTALFRPDYYS